MKLNCNMYGEKITIIKSTIGVLEVSKGYIRWYDSCKNRIVWDPTNPKYSTAVMYYPGEGTAAKEYGIDPSICRKILNAFGISRPSHVKRLYEAAGYPQDVAVKYAVFGGNLLEIAKDYETNNVNINTDMVDESVKITKTEATVMPEIDAQKYEELNKRLIEVKKSLDATTSNTQKPQVGRKKKVALF